MHHRPIDKDQSDNPLRGSTLLLEQSMTTQTARLEPSAEQSYVPLYELWLSFRPRYYFGEHWSVRGRFDYTKELTNNQTTTYYREDVFGDIWTDLVYSTRLDTLWPGTKASLGVRALWPTSKASQANGTYVTLGAIARRGPQVRDPRRGRAVVQRLSRGPELHVPAPVHAPRRRRPRTATSSTRGKTWATTTTRSSATRFRDRRSSTTALVVLDTGLQITPKLSLTLDGILINQWHYAPTGSGDRDRDRAR